MPRPQMAAPRCCSQQVSGFDALLLPPAALIDHEIAINALQHAVCRLLFAAMHLLVKPPCVSPSLPRLFAASRGRAHPLRGEPAAPAGRPQLEG
jgi:hypothetical protein